MPIGPRTEADISQLAQQMLRTEVKTVAKIANQTIQEHYREKSKRRFGERRGRAVFVEMVRLLLGPKAFAQESRAIDFTIPYEVHRQRFEQTKGVIGINPKVAYAYILGPQFALDDGGLALMRTVFGNSPAVVIVRNQEDEVFIKKHNEELTRANRPGVLWAYDIQEGQEKLHEWIQKLDRTQASEFTFHGIVNAKESLAEALKEALREHITLMTEEIFNRMKAFAGIGALVEALRAQFRTEHRLAQSA